MTLVPEFYLLNGDLLVALPNEDGAGAEPWFQRAFEVAHDLGPGCRSCEPAIRLCRLRRDQGDREQGGTGVAFTSARIRLFQDQTDANGDFGRWETLVLTVNCTFGSPTSDGAVPSSNFSCQVVA